MLVHAITSNITDEFAADVRAGLTKPGQKELLSKYLYDDVGSALFEVISHLPEYGLTRADERLLRRHAGDIVERIASPVAVAELGSGSGRKTRQILEALCRRQRNTRYYPIEISPTALAMCERELSDIDCISHSWLRARVSRWTSGSGGGASSWTTSSRAFSWKHDWKL